MSALATLPAQSGLTTAAGVIALLEEDGTALKIHALERLNQIVDIFWPEIADSISAIEELAEDEDFPKATLAAALASKCYYHLEAYEESLRLALAAGDYFDINAQTEYVDTLVSKCIDEYIALRVRADSGEEDVEIDERMEAIVEDMFERCFQDGSFKQALGIALEARRLDKVEEAITRSTDAQDTLSYCFQVCTTLVSSRKFRQTVLRSLVQLYRDLAVPDFLNVASCLLLLGDTEGITQLLQSLLQDTGDNAQERVCTAYQIAFDLVEADNQDFLLNVLRLLPTPEAETTEESSPGDTPSTETTDDKVDGEDAPAAAAAEAAAAPAASEDSEELLKRLKAVRRILSGDLPLLLNLYFLHRNNKADLVLLRNIQTAAGNRNSVLHNMAIIAHGLMHCGTTVDTFLRNNMQWLARAQNWARFSATATLGMVHKGHLGQAMALLEPYLPQNGNIAHPFSEGGALYALGLIHANKGFADGAKVITYLKDTLIGAAVHPNEDQRDVVQHGACLGLGLAAMAAGGNPALAAATEAKEEEGEVLSLYQQMQNVMHLDSAVAGEGAAFGMGLLLLGQGEAAGEEAADILAYAHETKHEKIIRGLGMSLAFIMYGQEENADALIEQLSRERDALLRYGGMWTIAMAYAGTANNAAVRKLLHVAVSDVSGDVRRAAVTALGFVLFKTPEQVPPLLSLLSESYNPHVRVGVAMAVGIACAGRGDRPSAAKASNSSEAGAGETKGEADAEGEESAEKDAAAAADSAHPGGAALDLLWPLLRDPIDFVRQGALMAAAMVLMQETEVATPRVKELRHRLSTVLGAKFEPALAKMGAILAAGILDAGGRNVVLSLASRNGLNRRSGIVGAALFCQGWFWFPLFHSISLAFAPTAMIGLNQNLEMPKPFSGTCAASPALFAYPKPLKVKVEEKKARVKTAVLSTTAKAKARARRKEKEKEKNAAAPSPAAEADAEMTDAADKPADETPAATEAVPSAEEAAAEPAEPISFTLSNPCRVTPKQAEFVSFGDQRYQPIVKNASRCGIMLLLDSTPEEAEEIAELKTPVAGEEEEPEPPEPFIWTPPAPAASAD